MYRNLSSTLIAFLSNGHVLVQNRVRDPRAGYFQSLDVLKAAKACGVYTKSSIMLGLGETHDEIIDTMYDLKDAVSCALLPLAPLTGLVTCCPIRQLQL